MKTTRWVSGAWFVACAVVGLSGAAPVNKVQPPAKPAATNVVAAVAGEPELKEGLNNNVKFAALTKPEKHPAWIDYRFTPAEESFTVYIPKGLTPSQPCGVLGWINPTDGSGLPKQFLPLFDEFQMIGICAANCGNNQKTVRRLGLIISAMLQLGKTYKIDPARRVLSGLSGGGRESAEGGFIQPDLISGVISWCGSLFYKNIPNSEKPGKLRGGINFNPGDHYVTTALVGEAKRRVKFVLLTGPKDFNLMDSRDIKAAFDKERYKALLIEVPGLGHQVGEAEYMRKGMVFVLGEPGKP